MRELLLAEIERIRKAENNFDDELWNDFMFGAFHISIAPITGAPDNILFELYNEICKVHYTKRFVSPKLLDSSIRELNFSNRTRNSLLLSVGIRTIGQLVQLTEEDLMMYKGIGRHTMREIEFTLIERRLTLGMKL